MKKIGILLLAAGLLGALGLTRAAGQVGAGKKNPPIEELPPPKKLLDRLDDSSSIPAMSGAFATIDLASALRLAGVENPAIVLARQRVVEAVAVRQLAAAQVLPSLNAGLNYDSHKGPLQQANGNILKVNRSALYLGAGANAVAAGTVNIPGVVYNLNLSEAIFAALASRQLVVEKRFASRAAQNEGLKRVALAYAELLREEGRRAVTFQVRTEAEEVARLTAVNAKFGQGRQGDADRAATEFARRSIDLVEAESGVESASARLAELLNLDPATRLHPAEEQLVPMPVVPDPIPLSELLAIALVQRPELGERRAAIRRAMLALDNAKLLPFSPNLIVGFSSGTFGGGSSELAAAGASRFGNFGARNDFDVIAYWTLQNLGIGNLALVREASSRLRSADLERLAVLNRIRGEVASAYVRSHVRFAQIAATEKSVRSGLKAFAEDLNRIKGNVGLPIELLASLQLLAQARHEYLNAIVNYNEAQLELYVALGQPPAEALARPVPRDFTPPRE